MAGYPVDDDGSLQGAVNDLLSGPSGLGQNFQGFSDYAPAYIRPTFRAPFTLPITTTLDPRWYVDIPIGNIAPIDGESFQITFSSAQSSAPFQFGDRIDVINVTDDLSGQTYNGQSWRVFDSTTTYANVYFPGSYSWANYVSGGNVVRNYMNTAVSADNNARITVLGPTDQAFVTSQIRLDVDYTCTGASDFRVQNTIERWRGYPIQGTEDYTFALDEIVSRQAEDFSVTSSGSVPVEAIFTTVLDSPDFGYYWYFNNIYFLNLGGLVPSQTSVDPSWTYYQQYLVESVSPIASPGSAYTNVQPMTVTGTGSGADLDIYLYSTAYPVVFTSSTDSANINFEVTTVNSPGSGYAVGDLIKILGTDVGGSSPDNDIVLKINAVDNANSCYAGNVVVGVRSLTAQVIKQ